MNHLMFAILSAVRSLFAPGMLRVFILSVAVTLASLIVFFTLASSAFLWLASQMDNAWIGVVGSVGSGLIAWCLFPGIMPVVVNFFDDRIAGIIERQDYPNTVPREPDFWPELFHDARFTFTTLFLNIAALPLYLIPFVNLLLFYGLNGYLLGREFFTMAARRHMPLPQAERLRKQHSRLVTLAGMLLVLCAVIPIVNLFAPFWGIAMMTHLYHRLGGPPELLERA